MGAAAGGCAHVVCAALSIVPNDVDLAGRLGGTLSPSVSLNRLLKYVYVACALVSVGQHRHIRAGRRRRWLIAVISCPQRSSRDGLEALCVSALRLTCHAFGLQQRPETNEANLRM